MSSVFSPSEKSSLLLSFAKNTLNIYSGQNLFALLLLLYPFYIKRASRYGCRQNEIGLQQYI